MVTYMTDWQEHLLLDIDSAFFEATKNFERKFRQEHLLLICSSQKSSQSEFFEATKSFKRKFRQAAFGSWLWCSLYDPKMGHGRHGVH